MKGNPNAYVHPVVQFPPGNYEMVTANGLVYVIIEALQAYDWNEYVSQKVIKITVLGSKSEDTRLTTQTWSSISFGYFYSP